MSRHRFNGDERRFEVIADFVAGRFPELRYVADVAGGQGMLSKLLGKRHGVSAEVIDPRGHTLKGVAGVADYYDAGMADFYDVVVGLHPDQAIREVAASALVRPTVLVPCCNFWDSERKLGREALRAEIKHYYDAHGVRYEEVRFDFKGPQNIGLVSTPPAG